MKAPKEKAMQTEIRSNVREQYIKNFVLELNHYPITLFNELDGKAFNLLLLTGKHPSVRVLRGIDDIEDMVKSVKYEVKVHVISFQMPLDLSRTRVLVDRDRQLHRHFEADKDTMILIRPDRSILAVVSPINRSILKTLITQFLKINA